MFGKLDRFFHKQSHYNEVEEIGELTGTHAAILATDGFEQSELFEPKAALEAVGVKTHIISLKPGKIKAWNEGSWGKSIDVDMVVLDALTEDFDFLVLPGGVLNPDKLRSDDNVIAFVQKFVNRRRPIAAICHGVQTLIETGMVRGRTLTSWPSLKTDLINAGAKWLDKEVIVDHHLITSRKPADIPSFNQAMIREFITYHTQHSLPNTESYVVTL